MDLNQARVRYLEEKDIVYYLKDLNKTLSDVEKENERNRFYVCRELNRLSGEKVLPQPLRQKLTYLERYFRDVEDLHTGACALLNRQVEVMLKDHEGAKAQAFLGYFTALLAALAS